MNLFQQASMWSLRALLVWGVFEAGSVSYNVGIQSAGSMTRIAGHQGAMTRLEERARASEAQAQAREAALAELSGDAWSLSLQQGEGPGQAAARALRDELQRAGAQAAVVDATEGNAPTSATTITLTARWREPVETSPQALHELALRVPQLKVQRLVISRENSATAEAVFVVAVAAAPQIEAAR